MARSARATDHSRITRGGWSRERLECAFDRLSRTVDCHFSKHSPGIWRSRPLLGSTFKSTDGFRYPPVWCWASSLGPGRGAGPPPLYWSLT
jgi:hypothetical protein